jgi:DNA invertase Pin-like site-specific DNA recombinase
LWTRSARPCPVRGRARQLLAEYVEVESDRKGQPTQLRAALEDCRKRGAVLVIALTRLARNVAFIANLMNSDVEFVAVDMPHANRLTIHILAAVAEHPVPEPLRDALHP